MSSKSIVLLVLLALAVFWTVGGYNRLMRLKNSIGQAFSAIDFQFKDRHDLLLKLAEAAGDYLQHETETLKGLMQARSDSSTAHDAVRAHPSHARLVRVLMAEEHKLNQKIDHFWAAEAHNPTMLAEPKIRELAQQLINTQGKLAFGCEGFNESVILFNAAQRQFPTVVIARLFGFSAATTLTMGLSTS